MSEKIDLNYLPPAPPEEGPTGGPPVPPPWLSPGTQVEEEAG